MNKNDLVSLIADRTGFSKVDAGKAVDSVLGAITEALQSGTSVRLSGFGTFTISKRAASEGRNPRTGEKIQLPESDAPEVPRRQAAAPGGELISAAHWSGFGLPLIWRTLPIVVG